MISRGKRFVAIATTLIAVALACATSAAAAGPDDLNRIGWHELPGTALTKATVDGRSICPPDDPTIHGTMGCSAVIRAWGSAVADTKRNRLILWGGGHNDYYGNELYALDLESKPAKMVRLNEPTRPGNGSYGCHCSSPVTGACNVAEIPPEGSGPKAPNSRHTYNQIEYIPGSDELFAFGGFTAGCIGVAHEDAWLARLSALQDEGKSLWARIDRDWKTQGTAPGKASAMPFGGNMAYDDSRKAVWFSDQVGIFLLEPDQLRTSYRGEVSVGLYAAMALDPSRNMLFFIGWDGGQQKNKMWMASTALRGQVRGVETTARMKGCSALLDAGRLNNIGLVYDPVWKLFVAWPNFGSSVFLINSSNEAINLNGFTDTNAEVGANSCLELSEAKLGSHGPPDSSHTGEAHSSNGTFGRFRYFPSIDAYALCSDSTSNCYLLRLRAHESVKVVSH